MQYLSLYLRAPMQSWGVAAKFGDRPSLSFPSKSGIIGMLAAAAGVDRTDGAWLQMANSLSMRCLVFKPGRRLQDYHTVGGGYDAKHSWSRRRMSAKADGGTPSTVLTTREYLQDAIFGVVLGSENTAFFGCLVDAIRDPIWGIWLGRKSCIPTEPIYAGYFETTLAAEAALQARAMASLSMSEEVPVCKIITEVPVNEAEEVWHDLPVNFAKREFAPRAIRQEIP